MAEFQTENGNLLLPNPDAIASLPPGDATRLITNQKALEAYVAENNIQGIIKPSTIVNENNRTETSANSVDVVVNGNVVQNITLEEVKQFAQQRNITGTEADLKEFADKNNITLWDKGEFQNILGNTNQTTTAKFDSNKIENFLRATGETEIDVSKIKNVATISNEKAQEKAKNDGPSTGKS